MPDNLTPRQIVKNLLQGIAPPRPLFLPVVFARGARIENLPLREFVSSPQKLFNSLRQIRAHLRSDGITCYFDPFLEAETLGAVVEWDAAGARASLRWPHAAAHVSPGATPAGQSAPLRGRDAVAVEVIRRLKAVVRDDCLLTAGVTGPVTLAAMMARMPIPDSFRYGDLDSSALDRAASVVSGIAKAFVEAGANVIFLREDAAPPLSPEDAEDWSSRLATAVNIVRFYEALPVLLLTQTFTSAETFASIAGQSWDCVVCFSLGAVPPLDLETIAGMGAGKAGIALPVTWFEPAAAISAGDQELARRAVAKLQPAIVTTSGDLPSDGDFERLKRLWEDMRR
jgi:Uroporphyrinogen decarboxylase (URO-D)